MLSRRILLSFVIISTCVLGAGQIALAKNPHHMNGPASMRLAKLARTPFRRK